MCVELRREEILHTFCNSTPKAQGCVHRLFSCFSFFLSSWHIVFFPQYLMLKRSQNLGQNSLKKLFNVCYISSPLCISFLQYLQVNWHMSPLCLLVIRLDEYSTENMQKFLSQNFTKDIQTKELQDPKVQYFIVAQKENGQEKCITWFFSSFFSFFFFEFMNILDMPRYQREILTEMWIFQPQQIRLSFLEFISLYSLLSFSFSFSLSFFIFFRYFDFIFTCFKRQFWKRSKLHTHDESAWVRQTRYWFLHPGS